MPQRDTDPSILEVWLDHPAATLAAAAAGAAACAVASQYFLADVRAGGDEAPIRVRNGSMKIELVGMNQKFEERGNSGQSKWKIKNDPNRSRPRYVVLALTRELINLPNGFLARGKKVVVQFSDAQEVSFQANGVNTWIDAIHPLQQTAGQEERLNYSAVGPESTGHIRQVTVHDGGQSTDLYVRKTPDSDFELYLLDLPF